MSKCAMLVVGNSYSRPTLADMWGYRSWRALARGVVTPQGSHEIILFVTENKQECFEQYEDRLVGDELLWEGPSDHFAEERMLASANNGDMIHVLHRERHHSDFIYLGEAEVVSAETNAKRPSKFRLKLRNGQV